jgi:hypothetical protein
MLARQAATLDPLSGGRLDLGLGRGAFWDGIAALGGPRRSPGATVDALDEAIGVIRALWTGRRVSLEGRHYALHGASGSAPPHGVEIWIGALRPRMLRLVGRAADGWVPSHAYVPPAALRPPTPASTRPPKAAGAGRRTSAASTTSAGGSRPASTPGALDGPSEHRVEELARFVELGMDTFVFWPTAGDVMAQVRRFAREIVPAVRALDVSRPAYHRCPSSSRSAALPIRRHMDPFAHLADVARSIKVVLDLDLPVEDVRRDLDLAFAATLDHVDAGEGPDDETFRFQIVASYGTLSRCLDVYEATRAA